MDDGTVDLSIHSPDVLNPNLRIERILNAVLKIYAVLFVLGLAYISIRALNLTIGSVKGLSGYPMKKVNYLSDIAYLFLLWNALLWT
jgi:hypothetical protein